MKKSSEAEIVDLDIGCTEVCKPFPQSGRIILSLRMFISEQERSNLLSVVKAI